MSGSLVSDDWPPFASEEVIGEPAGQHRFILRTPPAFAFGLAVGDTVLVRHDGVPEVLWISEIVAEGGHSTVRVIPIGTSGSMDQLRTVAERLCTVHTTAIERLLAIDVPVDADYAALIAEFERRRELGTCDYSIGVVSGPHEATGGSGAVAQHEGAS